MLTLARQKKKHYFCMSMKFCEKTQIQTIPNNLYRILLPYSSFYCNAIHTTP